MPADPSMSLGAIVNPRKLETLKELGKILEPQQLAREKLNVLLLASYNMNGLYVEMASMEMPQETLQELKTQIDELKKKIAEVAVEMATITIKCQTDAAAKKMEQSAKSGFEVELESPYNMGNIGIKAVPHAMDSVNFDVQYFRNEETTDTSDSIASYVAGTLSGWGKGYGGKIVGDSQKATKTQNSAHKTEGTMVIIANCTHKKMNMITSHLDARRTLNAWNQLFPEDYLRSNLSDMMKAATAKPKKGEDNKSFSVISGASYGSTFVGLVHILETEESKSEESTKSGSAQIPAGELKEALKTAIGQDMMLQNMTGGFGVSSSFAESTKSLTSSSKIYAHCSLICQGIIPSITRNNHTSSLKAMQPNTNEIMVKLNAVRGDGGPVSAIGQQFMSLEKKFLEASLSGGSSKKESIQKVMDVDTLLDSFCDYLSKAGSEGSDKGGGIPLNFSLKHIDKATVAKTYISQFYSDGGRDAGARYRANLGQESEKKAE